MFDADSIATAQAECLPGESDAAAQNPCLPATPRPGDGRSADTA